MNYNSGFNYSDLFTDKKYRSRLILAVYVIIFIVLIAFLRTGMRNEDSNNNSNSIEEPITNIEENVINNDDDTTIIVTEDIENKFSHINMYNYNFEYTLYYKEGIYVAKGKRYDEKYDFTLSDGSNTMHYLSRNKIVRSKNQADLDSSYQMTIFPFVYIDYYDIDTLKLILSSATQVADEKYEIDNEDLLKYVNNNNGFQDAYLSSINTIDLELRNDKIVAITLDISNLAFGFEETSTTKIELMYSDFGLIDDFDVIFE